MLSKIPKERRSLFIHLLNMNVVEHSPPAEVIQEISYILMKPEVHYRIHNSLPLFLALRCRSFESCCGHVCPRPSVCCFVLCSVVLYCAVWCCVVFGSVVWCCVV